MDHIPASRRDDGTACVRETHHRRRIVSFFALIALTAVLVACSRSGDADSGGQPSGDASPTSPEVTATQAVAATSTAVDRSPTSTLPASSPTPSAAPPTATTEATQPPTPTEPVPTPTTPLATHGNSEIYVINVDGTGERNLTNVTTAESMPMWSPDGDRIAYRSSETEGRGGGVYVMRSDGSGVEELLPPTSYGYAKLSWLLNNRLAYMTCDGFADCGVFTGDVGGTNRERLPAPEGGYDQITWSPDATRIAYISSHSGNSNLFVMTVADGSVRQITDTIGEESAPAWSPDGGLIVYTRWDTDPDTFIDTSSLLLIDAEATGAEPHVIHVSEEGAYDAAWSPDGRELVFVSGRGWDTNLWIINVDGSGLRQLTHAASFNDDPTWSPDGTQIAFVSTRDGGQPVACNFSTTASMRYPLPMESKAWEVHAIVVGTVMEALAPAFADPSNPELNESPEIVTDYLLTVEQQYRGYRVESTIRLRVGGGTIGDCVQTHSPNVELTVGDRLLLFLYVWQGDSTLPDAFVSSVQGIWDVTERDTIVTPEFAMNPPGYDGISLDAVRDLIVTSLSGAPPSDVPNAVSLEEAPLTE